LTVVEPLQQPTLSAVIVSWQSRCQPVCSGLYCQQ